MGSAFDPSSSIVDAVSAGSAAESTGTASPSVSNAYQEFKRVLARPMYASFSWEALENNPASPAERARAAEFLQSVSAAAEDRDLLRTLRTLVAALLEHDSTAAAAVGVDLKRIHADVVDIQNIGATSGAGVIAHDVSARSILIRGVDASRPTEHPRPAHR